MSRLSSRTATLAVICCVLLVHCATSCEAPRVPALPALGASSSTTSFDEVLKKGMQEVVEGNPGPRDRDDPHAVAQHKRDLAQHIAQRLQHLRGANGVHKLVEFKLTLEVVVWERDLSPDLVNRFSYGNSEHLELHGPNIQLPFIGAERGALPFSEGPASSKAVPGFPRPCKHGGSAFTVARMRNDVEMACMVFYAPYPIGAPPQAGENVAKRKAAFKAAIKDCTQAANIERSIGDEDDQHRLDLDKCAWCIHRTSSEYLRDEFKLRGIAIIPILRHTPFLRPGQNLLGSTFYLHPDIGVCLPQGTLLVHVKRVFTHNEGRVTMANVIIFSSMGYLQLQSEDPAAALEGH